MRRARAGLALEDFINAFRVGQQVFWEAVLDCAGSGALGREAALTLALGETRTLVVGRQGDVVAVPALGPACDAVEMCARVERVCARTSADGLPLALGRRSATWR